MNLILQGLAALCWGATAFAGSWYLLLVFSQLEVEKRQETERRRLPLLFRLLLPLTPNLRFIAAAPTFATARQKHGERLQMAGYDEQIMDGETFVAIQAISTGFGLILLIFNALLKHPFCGVAILAVLYLWPEVWLRKTVARRHLEIQKALPNVLDLLTLSVEAGKDFLTALRDILQRRRVRDALHEELARAFHEIQLGKPRRQALRELAQRVQQPDLSAVVNAIVQADELGVSISQLLRIQGDQFRAKRFQRAETLANEAPVKIIFPVVIFIFPAVFIIILGPIILQAAKTLLAK